MNQNNRILVRQRIALLIAILVFGSITASAQSNVFNLADFDPVGDGVADDGPAFQRALDALADAGGGTLLVPAGRYLITTPVIKDFSALNGGTVIIQGVPSTKMPAPPTAGGEELARSLDLQSEIFPATGFTQSALTLTNLKSLTVEHLAFTGKETTVTDAFITLNMSDIVKATVYHCEFYGISTFGLVAGLGGGNLIRATRSDLSIQQTIVLGSTANSGAYAPIVENVEWHGFQISNSIFIDYGLRSFFGKMGLGAPLSWINLAAVAPRTLESSRREVVIRDTFFDEGGWIGITATPHRWQFPIDPIDLIYISGLKMNVSNLGTAGHQFFDVSNVLIENSHYGWSKNTGAAIDVYRGKHTILDRLTCIEEADRIRVDARTERLTVINSEFGGLDSLAQTTTVLETAANDDPVQFVRQQFLSLTGKQPEPAAHFYWADLLIRCGSDRDCLDNQHAELQEYLKSNPQTVFAFGGTVTDENSAPVHGIKVTLTGSHSASGLTDAQGKFQFLGLPTSGVYTVTVNNQHYTFSTISHSVERPARDVSVAFSGRLNRYTIAGRITKADGTGASGVNVQLAQTPTSMTTTDADGNYSFADLAAGQNYTVVPSVKDFLFFPTKTTLLELSSSRTANFAMRLTPELLLVENSENALVLGSTTFLAQPLSISDFLGYGKDGINRVMIFARNLEGLNDPSLFTVVAEDSAGQTYPLEIEFIGDVPLQTWLKQVNVKLAPELSGKCVRLRLSSGDFTSNTARICLAGQ